MAQYTEVTLICDKSHVATKGPHKGEKEEVEATETFRWADLSGAWREIDVCATHAAEIRDGFEKIDAGSRRATSPARSNGRPGGYRRTVAGRQRSGDIRAWAKDRGIAVSERGRIPATVVGQYNAQH